MNITIHHGHIDHRHGYDHHASADSDAFTAWVAAWCKSNWHRWFDAEDPDEAMPETDEEIVEMYFERTSDACCGDGEYFHHDVTGLEIPLPEPYASAPALHAALIACVNMLHELMPLGSDDQAEATALVITEAEAAIHPQPQAA